MPFHRPGFILLFLCLLTALLASCSRREAPADAAIAERHLLVGNLSEPADLDPHLATAYTDQNILVALFEGLTALDEKASRPVPATANRWDVSADGLTYTFGLKGSGRCMLHRGGLPSPAQSAAQGSARAEVKASGQPGPRRTREAADFAREGEFPLLAHRVGREVFLGALGRTEGGLDGVIPRALTQFADFRQLQSGLERRLPELLGQRLSPAGGADRPAHGEIFQPERFPLRFVTSELDEDFFIALARRQVFAETAIAAPVAIGRPSVASNDASQAAPAKLTNVLRSDDPGADGIEVDVVDDARQRSGVLNQQGLIAPLKQMSPLLTETVDPRGPSALQPMHTFDQIRFRVSIARW